CFYINRNNRLGNVRCVDGTNFFSLFCITACICWRRSHRFYSRGCRGINLVAGQCSKSVPNELTRLFWIIRWTAKRREKDGCQCWFISRNIFNRDLRGYECTSSFFYRIIYSHWSLFYYTGELV